MRKKRGKRAYLWCFCSYRMSLSLRLSGSEGRLINRPLSTEMRIYVNIPEVRIWSPSYGHTVEKKTRVCGNLSVEEKNTIVAPMEVESSLRSRCTKQSFSSLKPLSSDRMDGCRDWASIAAEILILVIQKVQERATEENGEMRRLLAMAGVCRSWRLVIESLLACSPFSSTGLLQFPCSLREAGPLDKPMQCVMRRRGSTFLLYQSDCGPGQELRDGKCNFLMAACKRWRPGHILFVISADRRNFSRKSFGFMGKLRSNFWGTAFVLWDHQSAPSGSYNARPVTFVRFTEEMVEGVSQRKMTCAVKAPRAKARGSRTCCSPMSHQETNACFAQRGPKTFWRWGCMMNLHNSIQSVAHTRQGYQSLRDDLSKTLMEERSHRRGVDSLIPVDYFKSKLKLGGLLKKGEKVATFTSKIPEWDVERQCWSMNFNGRETLPSMHNFQLLMPEEKKSRPVRTDNSGDQPRQQRVVMQVGKIGKGLFALEFHYPLSAFQAFNIALSSFATTVGVDP